MLSRQYKIVLSVVFVIFLLYGISLVYPLVWVLFNSFRDKVDFLYYPLSFPTSFTLKNYAATFTEYNILSMFLNSIILSVGGVVATILSSSMAAYIISKYRFRGRNFIYTVAIMIMIIPTTGSIATTYRLMNDSGLAGTHIGLIISYAGGFGTNFFLLHGFFKNLSWSYGEAAMIDGAGHARIFWSIMLPLALPSLVAVGILSFIGLWNDYYAPYMYLREYPTLAVGIYLTSNTITGGGQNSYDYPALFAIMTVSIIPVIVCFSVFQKTIIENTVAGGLKG